MFLVTSKHKTGKGNNLDMKTVAILKHILLSINWMLDKIQNYCWKTSNVMIFGIKLQSDIAIAETNSWTWTQGSWILILFLTGRKLARTKANNVWQDLVCCSAKSSAVYMKTKQKIVDPWTKVKCSASMRRSVYLCVSILEWDIVRVKPNTTSLQNYQDWAKWQTRV